MPNRAVDTHKKEQRIPVAVRSKAYFCDHSIVGVAGLNHADGMVVLLFFVVFCVGSVFCDELITLSEESTRVCVSLTAYIL